VSAWASARERMFGEPYMVWHDGPEFSGLREEWKRDPEALLELLFEGMAEDDPLASQSFAELDPAPTGELAIRVIAKLTEHLATSGPMAVVQISRTLFRLTGSTVTMQPILDVLDSALHWSDRIDAAIALRDFPPSDAGRACLLRNVQAEDYLVRYHCASTLLRWAGAGTSIEDDDELFTLLVKDEDPDAWAQVAAALGKL
jgi:hypothetical protein